LDSLFSNSPATAAGVTPVAIDRYLHLLKGCLTRELFLDEEVRNVDLRSWAGPGTEEDIRALLRSQQWRLVRSSGDAGIRNVGHDWPPHAETMVGAHRLDNVHRLVVDVLERGVPGDLMETGVWRGGVAIFMRAVLAAHDVTDRTVWLADSFAGLPAADAERFPADVGINLDGIPALEVSLEQVQANFARYRLLDAQVGFIKGWFKDTLPTAPVEQLAVLRLDGDLYQSTWEALENLYPKVSIGGFVIVDDFGGIAACAQAVHDYRDAHGIVDPIETVDWTGVYWQKTAATGGATQ